MENVDHADDFEWAFGPRLADSAVLKSNAPVGKVLLGHFLGIGDRTGIGIEANRADRRPGAGNEANEESGSAAKIEHSPAMRNPAEEILEWTDIRSQGLENSRPSRGFAVQ